jgi:N-acetylmuramoyl-L-alanine amidase
MLRVILDPGHGGQDPGAAGVGGIEKAHNYAICQAIRQALLPYMHGLEVVLLQPSEYWPDIAGRDELNRVVDTANMMGYELFLSIHLNAAGGKGFESFTFSPEDTTSNKYRDVLHDEIMAYYRPLGIVDRGKKHENFKVLREAKGAASILLEMLFIDNPEDAAHLDDPAYVPGLAKAVAAGIGKALGVEPEATTEMETQEFKVALQKARDLAGQIYGITNQLLGG